MSQYTLTDKKRFEEELALKEEERVKIKEELAIARGHGDLSENAEYHAAREALASTQGRIDELKAILTTSDFSDDTNVSTDSVAVGTIVTVYDVDMECEETYTLVGVTEADPDKLWISQDAPIAAAMIGAHVGDEVEAKAPFGPIRLKILSISARSK